MRITSIPQIYRNVNRWTEILSTLSKYGLADWISRLDLSFAKGILKNRDGEALAQHARETRIRMALEELGPTFIKLGQILSTRLDVVGGELGEELKKLQANVPADPPEVARATIEQELQQPVDSLFVDFDDRPLASASIGQVHRARLATGEEVAVKVMHRGIEKQVRVDLDILSGIAQLAERVPELVGYQPRRLAAEFQRALLRELDFDRELRNLQQFARNFAGHNSLRIPRPYVELSTSRVLTMQYIDGIKLSELDQAVCDEAQGSEVARLGAEIFLEMIFHHGFYHADPHPGNLLLLPAGGIALLDCGMVGRINESLRENIEEMLLAIVGYDADRLTSLIVRIGSVPPQLDEAQLSADLADYVAHYAHQSVDRFDLSGALSEMIEIIRRYQIMLPAPIAMLLKVLMMLEGTVRLLNPKFSLMEVMEPYQTRMVRWRLSPTRHLKKVQRITYEMEQLLELLPRRLREILAQIQAGRFDVHLDHRGLEPSVNRLVLGMLASAIFLGSSLLVAQGVWPVRGVSVPGVLGYSVSLLLILRLLRAISKSGHLDRRR
ncbi:MAG: AarF/ABC1/UbiB kinase family protein [Planctomycetia bacterium]|nr:MAG: AarF/ABC1/UbiB kinase family protein [Planctomycetia bacterium]